MSSIKAKAVSPPTAAVLEANKSALRGRRCCPALCDEEAPLLFLPAVEANRRALANGAVDLMIWGNWRLQVVHICCLGPSLLIKTDSDRLFIFTDSIRSGVWPSCIALASRGALCGGWTGTVEAEGYHPRQRDLMKAVIEQCAMCNALAAKIRKSLAMLAKVQKIKMLIE